MGINNSIYSTGFAPITLAEMDAVKLMDRVDQKFLIPMGSLADILAEAQSFYRILAIDGSSICPYETLYYDTPALDLYHAHQSKRLNRYKVRYRNYVESKLAFFEIKHKTNKGRTKKTRIKQDAAATIDIKSKNSEFLETTTPLIANELRGVMWVNYNRMTLVSKNTTERLTIDLDLTFKNASNTVQYPAFAIAEVKQERMSGSVFKDLMRKYNIREGSISKYCLGIISLYKNVKHNNFKVKLKRINEITR